jgi:hypothetical protein
MMDYCKIVMEKNCEDYFKGDIVNFIKFLIANNKLTNEQKEALMAELA